MKEDETAEKIKTIGIEMTKDGKFIYRVNEESYIMDSVDEIHDAINDDLGSCHTKKKSARPGGGGLFQKKEKE